VIRATVIGAGSVGLAIAASLAVAGQRVTLLTRAGSVAALGDSAITVSGLHGDHTLPAGAVAIEDAACPSASARGCDMLVVTTKAHDIAAALAPSRVLRRHRARRCRCTTASAPPRRSARRWGPRFPSTPRR